MRLKQSKIFQSKKTRLTKISAIKGTGKPLYVSIATGLMLGYKRTQRGSKWYAKINGKLIGTDEDYFITKLGQTDDYCDANGIDFLSFAQAQQKLHNIKDSFCKQITLEKESVKFGKLADMYWEDYVIRKGDRVNSVHNHYLHRLKVLEVPLRVRHNKKPFALKDIRIDNLTYEDLNSIKLGIANTPTSRGRVKIKLEDGELARRRKSTANRFVVIIKAILNYGYENKRDTHIKTNAEWLRFKKFRGVDKPRGDWWERDECQRFLNFCNDKGLRNLFIGAISCGFRLGEQSKLTVGNVHLKSETPYVTVPANITKTNSERHVIIPTQFVDFFTTLIAGRSEHDRLFVKTSGSHKHPYWGHNHHNLGFRKVIKAAGLREMVWHSLRHTSPSQLVTAGVKLKTVANQLGHTTTYYVEKWYGHLADQDTLREVNKLGEYHNIIQDEATVVRVGTTGKGTHKPVLRDGRQPYAQKNFAVWAVPQDAEEKLKLQNDPKYQALILRRKQGTSRRGGGYDG